MITRKIALCLLTATIALALTGCINCCCNGNNTTGPNGDDPVPGPEHHTMPAPVNPAPSGPCGGNYCAFLIYNNSATAYKANDTTFDVQLTDGDGGPIIPAANYSLFWRRSATVFGCASDLDASTKRFVSTANQYYVLTVYFVPGSCPAQGHEIYLFKLP